MPNADYRFSIASDIVAAPLFCYAGFMNGNRTRVILYGDTLLLEGVQVNLKALTDLEVLDLPLETPLEDCYMGGIVNKYFGKTTQTLHWAIWTNAE